MYKEAKKRVQYLEYKFDSMAENRNLFERNDSYEEEEEGAAKKRIKTEVFNELNRIIIKKVDYFTADLKKLSMSA